MAAKRELKDAMSDEIVVGDSRDGRRRRPGDGVRRYGTATVLAAALLGFVGGVLLRRWLRWI